MHRAGGGKPTFQIGNDEMEMGVGIHGEPGRRRVKLASADAIAAELVGSILKDLSMKRGQETILVVNGFGGTPMLDLYLMVTAAHKVLAGAGIKVARHLTGSYVTSLEMAGCSISVTAVDAASLVLWDAPVRTAVLRWGVCARHGAARGAAPASEQGTSKPRRPISANSGRGAVSKQARKRGFRFAREAVHSVDAGARRRQQTRCWLLHPLRRECERLR